MKQAFVLFCYLFIQTFLFAQTDDIKVIELRNLPVQFKPVSFFITEVTDLRSNRSTIGYTDVGIFNKRYPADLKYGAEVAIESFLASNLDRDTNLLPVMMEITELTITESRSLRTGETGSCKFVAAFHSKPPGMPGGKIGEVTINISQSALRDISKKHEALIRQALEDALKEVDRFIIKNDNHPALLRGVKVLLSERTSPSSDTIFYANHPVLTIADFNGKPDPLSNAAAATYSGYHFSASTDIRNRFLQLSIEINTFFVTTSSWMREYAKDEFVLAHEQLHFDISRLVALQLKQDILSTTFPVLNCAELLDKKNNDADKMLKELQAKYDAETGHGLDKTLQLQWEEKIKMELARLSNN